MAEPPLNDTLPVLFPCWSELVVAEVIPTTAREIYRELKRPKLGRAGLNTIMAPIRTGRRWESSNENESLGNVDTWHTDRELAESMRGLVLQDRVILGCRRSVNLVRLKHSRLSFS